MTDETDDSEQEEQTFRWERLTVHAHGPAAEERDEPGGVTVVKRVQAQVDRAIRSHEDLMTILDFDSSSYRDREDAVEHLLHGIDGVRLPNYSGPGSQGPWEDWSVTVDGPVDAWLDLAERQSNSSVQPANVLGKLTKKSTVGRNAALAGIRLTADGVTRATVGSLETFLNQFQRKVGLEDDD